MAITDVTKNTESYPAIFRRRVLLNAKYWKDYVNKQANEVEALDHERDRIIKAISFALELDEAWPSVGELIETLSPYMERRGFWDTWNRVLKRTLVVARKTEDMARVVSLSVLLARLLFQQSRHNESVAYYRQTIPLARKIGDQFNEARACTNLGYYYVEHGQWYRAEVLCCHALELFEQLGSDHGRAHTENHLGVLYHTQGRWDEARHHLERACAIWQAMGDEHGAMRGFLNLGALYIHTGKFDEALEYLQKALSQAHLTGEEMAIGTIYSNMGMVYRSNGDLAKAETYSKQAETIFQQFSNIAELARVWNGLGLIYFSQDKQSEAISYLERSLEIWHNLGDKIREIKILIDIAECEFISQNWQEAKTQLNTIQQLIGPNYDDRQYRHLQPRIEKLCRSLSEKLSQQAATD